jgi:hypothetical protein
MPIMKRLQIKLKKDRFGLVLVTRGDVPTAQVTSVRGPDGIDGKTTITMDQWRCIRKYCETNIWRN